jgi:hypothetical protein
MYSFLSTWRPSAPGRRCTGDALAAGRELRLVAVDDRVKPGGFLGHEPAAGIDERARAGAAATLVACNELLALCGAQRLRGGHQ